MLGKKNYVWNITGLHNQASKIAGLESLKLCRAIVNIE